MRPVRSHDTAFIARLVSVEVPRVAARQAGALHRQRGRRVRIGLRDGDCSAIGGREKRAHDLARALSATRRMQRHRAAPDSREVRNEQRWGGRRCRAQSWQPMAARAPVNTTAFIALDNFMSTPTSFVNQLHTMWR